MQWPEGTYVPYWPQRPSKIKTIIPAPPVEPIRESSEDEWEPKGPIIPFRINLPSRKRKKRSYLRSQQFEDDRSDEQPLIRCFLIKKSEHFDFVNKHGVPGKYKAGRNELSQYRIEGTEYGRSKYTKLTVFASNEHEMNEAVRALKKRRDNLHKEKKRINAFFWKEIDPNHCTICYQTGHDRSHCTNCGWCLKEGHIRFNCPERRGIGEPKYHQQKTIVNLIANAESEKQKKIIKHANYAAKRRHFFQNVVERKPWFQKPGIVIESIIEKMKPIGPPYELKVTFALDTEGGGDGCAGNVHVSAWCGAHGAQTVFFTTIKKSIANKSCLGTPISGIQTPDVLYRSDDRMVVKKILISIFKNARVLYHGGGDLSNLGINRGDCEENNIETVDTQSLYQDSDGLLIGLATHDTFWYEGRILRREGDTRTSPINGHSPERDSRLTLKIYRKYYQFKEKYGMVPTGEEIRRARHGYNVNKWLKDHALN